MGPFKLHYNFRDLFLAPRLGLSGKKIWVFILGNLIGFVFYWIFSYLSLVIAGFNLTDSIRDYGLYPCLFGHEAQWHSWLVYYCGIIIWIFMIMLSSTAVSRITLKQLKGNDFFSGNDGWAYAYKHWKAVVLSPLTILLIIAFFIIFAGVFALMSSIPYLGEIIFAIPYLLYFFGSVFTIYTFFVLFVSLLFSPSIVGVYEEDTIGTVFNSYSITIGQGWRVIVYHLLLMPLILLSLEIMHWFWMNSIGFINYVFGFDWLMGEKLSNITTHASSIIFTPWIVDLISCLRTTITDSIGLVYVLPKFFPYEFQSQSINLSMMETISSVILSISYFLIGLSIVSYGLSIVSVGQTIMFIIFKKKSDDDDLLIRLDEDEIEDEIEELDDQENISGDDNEQKDK